MGIRRQVSRTALAQWMSIRRRVSRTTQAQSMSIRRQVSRTTQAQWMSIRRQVLCAAGPVRGGVVRGFAEPWHGIRKNGTYGGAIYPISKSVGDELSSRLVSKQVFSPLQSLTSVFGMGTGGPFALKSPTVCQR